MLYEVITIGTYYPAHSDTGPDPRDPCPGFAPGNPLSSGIPAGNPDRTSGSRGTGDDCLGAGEKRLGPDPCGEQPRYQRAGTAV